VDGHNGALSPVPDQRVRPKDGTDRCQVSTSMCFAPRSPWKTYLTNSAFNLQADRETNCTAHVWSTAQRPQAAERSPSTWPTDDTTATSATVAAINWNFGQQSVKYLFTRLPSIYAVFWHAKSLGFTAGDAPHPNRNRREEAPVLWITNRSCFPNNRKHSNCPRNWRHLTFPEA